MAFQDTGEAAMNALIALLLQNPQLLATILPLLGEIGKAAFPNVDPKKAAGAGSALFDSEHTKWVQTALNLLNKTPIKIDIDGVYGEQTKAAVNAFQTAHGLVADGWSGPKTNDALRAALVK